MLRILWAILFLPALAFGQVPADELVRQDLINAPGEARPGSTIIVQLYDDIPYEITPQPKNLIKLRDDDRNRVLLIQNAEPPGYEIQVNYAVIHPTEEEIDQAPLDDRVRFLEWLKAHSVDEVYRDSHTITVSGGPDPDPDPDPLSGAAKVAYDAAMLIPSNNRKAEAALFGVVLSATASKAAAVSNMTTLQIFTEAGKSIRETVPAEVLARWGPWKQSWGRYMDKAVKTREDAIKALEDSAKGLEAVR